MQLKQLDVSVRKLSGVGPKTTSLYKTLGIETIFDLITTPPRGYEDRTKRVCIGEQTSSLNQTNTVVCVLSKSFFGPRLSSVRIVVEDTENGRRGVLLGFNRSFLDKQVFTGSYYRLYANQIFQNDGGGDSHSNGSGGSARSKGSAGLEGAGHFSGSSGYKKMPEFSQFELKYTKEPDGFVSGGLLPVYGLTANLTQNTIRRDVNNALSSIKELGSVLPFTVEQKYNLMPYLEALKTMHAPSCIEKARECKRTLAFIELFYLQLSALRRPKEESKKARRPVKKYKIETDFIKNLPYKLTLDQENVLSEIRKDMASGERMNRLLQGDVGAGKTLVAWISALHAIAEGYQVAFMAPTELLARQHAASASVLLEKTGVNVAYLDGSVQGKSRALLLKGLENGNIDLLIGTHALFSKDVIYRNLGYVIIDEQHRFGVEQRTSLFNKGENPDVLLMTATPIPRTLALTMYGNLNVSFIKTMPAGRLPIKTFVIPSSRREEMYSAVEVELSRGHQAYFVYPRIEAEGEEGSEKDVKDDESEENGSLESGAECRAATSSVTSRGVAPHGDASGSVTSRDGAPLDFAGSDKGLKDDGRGVVRGSNSETSAADKGLKDDGRGFIRRSNSGTSAADKGLKDTGRGFIRRSNSGTSAADKGLKDVETMFEFLSKRYAKYRGALIHSRLSDEEKIRILTDFSEGKIDFLVATSVVEVGIDVKNATCMVVENAGNFGLSALHQLRGRVGRSTLQSWCFLVYDNPLSDDGKKRLRVLRSTNDGFVIAEEDLKIRGPGEITGLRQSGFLNLKYARLDEDIDLMAEVRNEVSTLLNEDAGLLKAENSVLRENLSVFCKGMDI